MSFVMSAVPTKAAVFTGARASARGSVRTVRAAAVPAVQIPANLPCAWVSPRSRPSRAPRPSCRPSAVTPRWSPPVVVVPSLPTPSPRTSASTCRGWPEEALVHGFRPVLRLRALQP